MSWVPRQQFGTQNLCLVWSVHLSTSFSLSNTTSSWSAQLQRPHRTLETISPRTGLHTNRWSWLNILLLSFKRTNKTILTWRGFGWSEWGRQPVGVVSAVSAVFSLQQALVLLSLTNRTWNLLWMLFTAVLLSSLMGAISVKWWLGELNFPLDRWWPRDLKVNFYKLR